MSDDKLIGAYKRAIAREKQARKRAEEILEEKSLDLFQSNKELMKLNSSLEQIVDERTRQIIKTNEEASRSAAEYRELFENVNDAVIIMDEKRLITNCNAAGLELLGISQDQIGKVTAKEFTHPEDKEKSFHFSEELRKEGSYSNYVGRIFNRQGKLIYIQASATAIYQDGVFTGSRDILRDITAQYLEEAQIKISEKEHRLLFFENPMPMLIYSRKSLQILSINKAITEQYGYKESDLIGKGILSEQFGLPNEPSFLSKENYETEIEIFNKKGVKVYVELKVNSITYQNEDAHFALLKDITSQKGAEAEQRRLLLQLASSNKDLRDNQDYLSAINDFSSSLLQTNTINEIAWFIVTNIIERLGFVDCVIYLLDEEGYYLIQRAAYGEKSKDGVIMNPIKVKVGNGIVGSVAASGKSELIKDTSQDHRYIIDDQARLSEITVPIVYNGKTIGVIDSEHPEKDFFTKEHLEALSSIANLAGTRIFNAIVQEKQKQTEVALIAATRKAEESSAAKEQFLANMSHEIRTPMNAILGMSQLLTKTPLSDRQGQYLSAISTSAENLMVIINDILDISKIEAGKLELEHISFDIHKLIENLLLIYQLRAEEKGITFKRRLGFQVPQFVKGDPYRLNQILINLVNNAIKFTNEGSVSIICQVIKTKVNVYSLEFAISDTGIGIEEEKISLIFQSFNQADTSITRKFGGTGLGLAITKQLVELMGGEVLVTSTFGEGTKFSFVIDLPLGAAEQSTASVVGEEQVSLQGSRVLVVEDHEINRFLALTVLDEFGCISEVAENGEEAISLLKVKTFDIVLMDIQMPVMGGIEATRIIRDELELDVPILALTANAMQQDRERYMNEGFNGYVSKPFESDDLFNKMGQLMHLDREVIRKQISNRSALEVMKPKEVVIATPVTAKPNSIEIEKKIPLYSLEKLQRMGRGKQEFVDKMVKMFVDRTPDLIKQMQELQHDKNYEELSKVAHKIKPSIDLLEMQGITEAIRTVEGFHKNKGPQNEFEIAFNQVVRQISKVILLLK